MDQQQVSGFTLIELMIALVILTLVVTIAYPYYVGFLLKSHRVDALSALAQDQLLLEHCYAQNHSYDQECTLLPLFPHSSLQGFYRISLTKLEKKTFILVATPMAGQAKDTQCAHITVNQVNKKFAVDSSGIEQITCWSPT